MSRIALLVIDMQNGYFQTDPLKSLQGRIVTACNELIRVAAAAERPVFLIRTAHARDRSTWTLNMQRAGEDFLIEGSEEADLLPELEKTADQIIKTRDSAFFKTDLAHRLREKGVGRVVVCGVSTHGCIMQTAMDAYAENFEVVIAGEAVATHDEAYHKVTLQMLEQEYGQKSLANTEVVAQLNSEG